MPKTWKKEILTSIGTEQFKNLGLNIQHKVLAMSKPAQSCKKLFKSLTQKSEVRCRGADEFDERFSKFERETCTRKDYVGQGKEWEEKSYTTDLQRLQEHVHLSKAWKPFVPNGSQQLLDVGVSNKREVKQAMIELRGMAGKRFRNVPNFKNDSFLWYLYKRFILFPLF